ncbi:MAG: hypothetical protein ABIH82_00800 [Candidatus Woesearchaeota archaeon]
MRQKVPDKKNAESIIEAAERDLEFTLTLPVNEQSAATIVRNIYECFRMLGDALLVIKGISTKDHITPIKELLNLPVSTSRPIQLIDNLRKTRHNINYYGYKPSLEEVKDTISLAESCFSSLLKLVKERTNNVR